MAGVLSFTLGIEVSNFLRGCGLASGQIINLIGGAKALHQVMEGTWAAIERGAALEHLSKRTGESVGNLFLLQKGLKAVGLDSSVAGTMLFQMNKALGGVNEMGEPTKAIFEELGLSIDTLKTKSAPEALQAIFEKLAKLNNASATFAASQIFGRGGAQDALQAARSGPRFGAALGDNKIGAEQAQRTASTFADIAIQMDKLQHQADKVFAGIAEAVGPVIEKLLQMSKAVDFNAIGQELGKFVGAFINAFGDGRLSELIGLSISTGVKLGLDSLPALFEQVGASLIDYIKTPLKEIQSFLEWLGYNITAALDKIRNPLHRQGLEFLRGYDVRADYKNAEGPTFNLGSGDYGTGDIHSDANQRLANITKNFAATIAPLRELVNELTLPKSGGMFTGLFSTLSLIATQAKEMADKKGNLDATKDPKTAKGKFEKPSVTEIEKMGFVFNGAGRGANDSGRDTVAGIRRSNDLLQNIYDKIAKPGGDTSFLNTI